MDVLSASFNDDKIAWYENLLTTTPTSDFSIVQAIKVFPNPFEDNLTIEHESLFTLDESILHLFDVTGRVMQTATLQNVSQQISTSQLSKGLYFYKVINDDGQMIANGKLVKQ